MRKIMAYPRPENPFFSEWMYIEIHWRVLKTSLIYHFNNLGEIWSLSFVRFGLPINLPEVGEGYQRGTGSSPGGMGVAPSEDKS